MPKEAVDAPSLSSDNKQMGSEINTTYSHYSMPQTIHNLTPIHPFSFHCLASPAPIINIGNLHIHSLQRIVVFAIASPTKPPLFGFSLN